MADLTSILTWCFVEAGKAASVDGLTSGIHLALRVVEQYFSRATARNTTYALEYHGLGWLDPDANHAYARRRRSTAMHPLCPVCDMDVEKATESSSSWRGRCYYFCMPEHRHALDTRPSRYVQASASAA